jgi:hypothetical protein
MPHLIREPPLDEWLVTMVARNSHRLNTGTAQLAGLNHGWRRRWPANPVEVSRGLSSNRTVRGGGLPRQPTLRARAGLAAAEVRRL